MKVFSEPGVLVNTQGIVGVLLVILSAICFGTNPIFARLSYEAGTNPTTYLFLRFLIAAPAMFILMHARGYAFPRGRILIELVMLGSIGVGTTFCFYTAIYYAPVSLIIVITYMYPTLVMLFSMLFLKKAITAFKILALFLSIIGISLTIGMDYGEYGLGIALAIATAICHSFFLILGTRSIQKAGSFQATTVITISSVVLYGLYVAIQGLQLPTNAGGWGAIAASGLFSTALGLVVFFAGLKRMETANAAIISTFEVVVTASLGMAILGELLSIQKVFGACLVISAIAILTKSEYSATQVTISKRGL